MESHTLFIVLVIFVAFVFDFINGFHDAANSIATIVVTGVLTPRQAVLWAAFFNFIAFLIFNVTVANTIGNGLIDTHLVNPSLILAALIGAIFWNLATWYYGLPSSSSHALIGGLAGAAVAKGGLGALKFWGFFKVGLGILFSPLLGFLIGLICSFLFSVTLKHYSQERLDGLFKGFQLASSALLSITHGANDAQKTMGIIAILLFSSAWLSGPFYVPFWVQISCQAVISFGTLFGGWRIVHTMGSKITHLNTQKGCAAETGAALTIFAATECGVPVSTTQTVTGSIAGVGIISGMNRAHWAVLRRIFFSWVLTIPAASLISAGLMLFLL